MIARERGVCEGYPAIPVGAMDGVTSLLGMGLEWLSPAIRLCLPGGGHRRVHPPVTPVLGGRVPAEPPVTELTEGGGGGKVEGD